MPGEVRLEPVVALTDAPTADENHAIGSGLARFNEQQSGLRGDLRGHGIVPCLPPGISCIFMTKTPA